MALDVVSMDPGFALVQLRQEVLQGTHFFDGMLEPRLSLGLREPQRHDTFLFV
jgi:hypothetical protein